MVNDDDGARERVVTGRAVAAAPAIAATSVTLLLQTTSL